MSYSKEELDLASKKFSQELSKELENKKFDFFKEYLKYEISRKVVNGREVAVDVTLSFRPDSIGILKKKQLLGNEE
ncbi:hypothetical protein [Cetobacterium sp.]|uniref:hypothetical protein n=1 Tax=Cetobacterium sp. TaxID=2071632 RepID=UPI003F3DB99B